jgi:hydroxymethylbilane synthase
VLERADAYDALIASRGIAKLEDLAPRARVGTSSPRRQAQLYAARPDLCIETLRGNVDTRLRRLDAGELDAILLACAGLARLGLESRITVRLDPNICLPAVGQGVIGIECRSDDAATRQLLAAIEHPATRCVLDAERAFAERLGGSCQSPIAAHAQLQAGELHLTGLVGEPDGSRIFRDSIRGSIEQAASLGHRLAERLMAQGAAELLERLRTA